jgi:hypothetical protein
MHTGALLLSPNMLCVPIFGTTILLLGIGGSKMYMGNRPRTLPLPAPSCMHSPWQCFGCLHEGVPCLMHDNQIEDLVIAGAPVLLHYSRVFNLPANNYIFDAHKFTTFNASRCPPWALPIWKMLTSHEHEFGMLPLPPEPLTFKEQARALDSSSFEAELVQTNRPLCFIFHL